MKWILTALVFTFLLSCQKVKNERIKIVFIAIDDLSNEAVQNSNIKTPNLDQLVNDGHYFPNHYVQVPTCGASRHSLIMSRLPKGISDTKNEIFQHSGEMQNPYASKIEGLRFNKIKTVGVGKISHSPDGYVYGYLDSVSNHLELPNSWDLLLNDPGKWGTGWNAFFGYSNGSNRNALKNKSRPYESVPDTVLLPDEININLATHQLTELIRNNENYFLAIGFYKPHLPFLAKEEFLSELSGIPFIKKTSEDYTPNLNPLNYHSSNEFNSYLLGDEKAGMDKLLSDTYADTLKRHYFGSVSFVDHQIGKIISKLKAEGEYDSTMIVVWSDHGYHLGEHRIWGKHSLFEEALNSPLIIKFPDTKRIPKIDTHSLIQSIDVFPTIYDYYSLNDFGASDGISILGNRKNHFVYSYFRNGGSIRNSKYRLTGFENEKTGTRSFELFDLEKFPSQTRTVDSLQAKIHFRELKDLLFINYTPRTEGSHSVKPGI